MRATTTFLLTFFLALAACVHAQTVKDSIFLDALTRQMDSLERAQRVRQSVAEYEQALLHDEMSLHFDDFRNLAAGTVITLMSHSFNTSEGRFFMHHTDAGDYVPAALPFAAAWAMKLCGVESRSKTRRMVMANAFAVAMTVGTTHLLKNAVNETRPDGKDDQSLPSGHTSLAFMSATILHREYGHISPWISVGGYGAATVTELFRIRHNDHYINDVLLGAGIGIACTNLAYYLTDRILGADQINQPRVTQGDVMRYASFMTRPTSVALISGGEFGGRSAWIETAGGEDIRVRLSTTFSTGAEYTYFLTDNFALEGLAKFSVCKSRPVSTAATGTLNGTNIYQYHGDVAARYSVPFGLSRRLSVRALAGLRHTSRAHYYGQSATGSHHLVLPTRNDFEAGIGFGTDLLQTKKYVSGLNIDYVHAFSPLLRDRLHISTTWKILL